RRRGRHRALGRRGPDHHGARIQARAATHRRPRPRIALQLDGAPPVAPGRIGLTGQRTGAATVEPRLGEGRRQLHRPREVLDREVGQAGGDEGVATVEVDFWIVRIERDRAVVILYRLAEAAEPDAGDATVDVGRGQPGVLTDRLAELVGSKEVKLVLVVPDAPIE